MHANMSSRVFVLVAGIVLATLVHVPGVAQAGKVQVVREMAEELLQHIIRREGDTALRQLGKLGAREGMEAFVERIVKEGGEELLQKTTRLAKAHGSAFFDAVEPNPKMLITVLDELPDSIRSGAINSLIRNPQRLTPLVNSHGKEALEAVARHPALAENAMEAFGKHGAALANQLDNVALFRTLRVQDDLLQLAPTQQRSVLDKIAKMPEVVLDYLEKHPRVLYTATGVATVLSLGHHALETDGDAVRPDGTREPSSPMDRFGQGFWNFLEHVADEGWRHMGPTAGFICMAGGAVLVLWMASRLGLNVRNVMRRRDATKSSTQNQD